MSLLKKRKIVSKNPLIDEKKTLSSCIKSHEVERKCSMSDFFLFKAKFSTIFKID